jgi:hypothetical protein
LGSVASTTRRVRPRRGCIRPLTVARTNGVRGHSARSRHESDPARTNQRAVRPARAELNLAGQAAAVSGGQRRVRSLTRTCLPVGERPGGGSTPRGSRGGSRSRRWSRAPPGAESLPCSSPPLPPPRARTGGCSRGWYRKRSRWASSRQRYYPRRTTTAPGCRTRDTSSLIRVLALLTAERRAISTASSLVGAFPSRLSTPHSSTTLATTGSVPS